VLEPYRFAAASYDTRRLTAAELELTEQLSLFDTRSSINADGAGTHLSVRVSMRARRLTLRMVPPHTLEVVVPRGTRPAKVQAFVAEHRLWIERARREIAACHREVGERLPTRVTLAALGREWRVRYRPMRVARAVCNSIGAELEVRSADPEFADAGRALRSWLLAEAKAELRPRLLREAEAMDRKPKAVQVRLQRTRWGSCSSSGTISLNAGLLFLEPRLVRYLLVHELCHLYSLGHSHRFWGVVERFEPDYRALDRRLTESWTLVPLWVHGA
jgi:predicted metal-dependent hydrolase